MKTTPRFSAVLGGTVLACLAAPGFARSLSISPQNQFPAAATPVTPTTIPLLLTQTAETPPVPPLPSQLPEAIQPTSEGIVGLFPEPSANLGIGHLRPRDLSELLDAQETESIYLGAGWLQAAAIPIHTAPGGNHWGWLVNGWLIPNGQAPIAIGRDATFSMLQTYDSLFSFPVLEMRDDGWFRLQYTPAGTAWAHLDHLNLGSIDLTIERWEDSFLATELIQFRRHGLSKPLHPTPTDEEAILGLVGPDSLIEAIAVEGDWMQVRVTQPTNGCEILSGARTQEGWLRWRNPDNQLLVWYPPQGC